MSLYEPLPAEMFGQANNTLRLKSVSSCDLIDLQLKFVSNHILIDFNDPNSSLDFKSSRRN